MAQTAILGKEITIEISEAMLIASRFAEVNGHAANASNAIKEVKFSIFQDLLTDEEQDILYQAQDLLLKIKSRTTQQSARYYVAHGRIEK